jgi:hypothetical protein
MRLGLGGLFDQPPAFILAEEIARIIAVISGEAGIDVVGADDDGLGLRPTLDHRTNESGHRQSTLGVDRVERAAIEKVVDFHVWPRSPQHRLSLLGRAARRARFAPAAQREMPLTRDRWITQRSWEGKGFHAFPGDYMPHLGDGPIFS